MSHQRVKSSHAPKSVSQKDIKEIQIVLALATYFEIHTKKTSKSSALYEDSAKYYGQNCDGFLSTSDRTDFGKHMFRQGIKCSMEQLNRTTSAATSNTFTGKQIWVKGRDARKQIMNVILPVYNSFLQSGGIFPSGWEIEDMLDATRRKLFLDSKKTTINLTNVSEEVVAADATEVTQETENLDVEDAEAADISITDSIDDDKENEISPDKISKSDLNVATKKSNVPKDLRDVKIPLNWSISCWTAFLWYGAPTEFLNDRPVHMQLVIKPGNGPDQDEDEEEVTTVQQRVGTVSLSRHAQKRKAQDEREHDVKSEITSESDHQALSELALGTSAHVFNQSKFAMETLEKMIVSTTDIDEKISYETMLKDMRMKMIKKACLSLI